VLSLNRCGVVFALSVELRFGDWVARLREGSHPAELMVEISTECNLSCVHCFRFSSEKFSKQFMDLGVFRAVLSKAEEAGVTKLMFSGWGEPTIHPYFTKFLEEAKSRGFYVGVNTNGYYLVELSEKLVELGVDEVYVSLDALDVELYSKIRKRGELPRVAKGLEKLLELKLSSGTLQPKVKVIFTVNRLNVGEIGKVLIYARSLGVSEVIYSYYIDYPGAPPDLDCLGVLECREKFREKLVELSVKQLELGPRVAKPSILPTSFRRCPFASNRALFVRVDGKVCPCIYYSRNWRTRIMGVERRIGEVVIGDIVKESLRDIWSRYAGLYFRLYFTFIPSCLDCSLVDYCSLTMSNEGDCWGYTPTCAHCPYLYALSYCPL